MYESILLDVDELGNGSSFGDFAVLSGEVSNETYITSNPAEIIILPAFDLKYMFTPQILINYKFLVNSYPKDSELREVYHDIIKWKNWKNKIIENVYIDKANNKLGHATVLRKPLLRIQKIMPMNLEIKTMMPIIEHKKLIFGEPPDQNAIRTLHHKTQSMIILKRISIKNKDVSPSTSLSPKKSIGKNNTSSHFVPDSHLNLQRRLSNVSNEVNNRYNYIVPQHKQHKKKQDSVITLNEIISTSPDKNNKKEKLTILSSIICDVPTENENVNLLSSPTTQNNLRREMSFLKMQRSIILDKDPPTSLKSPGINKNILRSQESIKLPQITNYKML